MPGAYAGSGAAGTGGDVVGGWLGGTLDQVVLAKFAIFAATLGTFAGALGGNLEDEGAFRSKLLIDEEV